ncbi:MAG: hypothetical protein ACTHWA_11110 [Arachnia sp.]
MGINPSIREFYTRSGRELDGDARRFETLASLGVASLSDLDDGMASRIRERCLAYFERNPYMEWFAPMEHLLAGLTGASFFDGTAYHFDLVHKATDPLWGRLTTASRQALLRRDHPSVLNQLGNPSLEIVYLNGKTVCEEVSRFIPLNNRFAQFRGQGPRRSFHSGRHGDAMVIGCSSNIQEERLKTVDRDDFMAWIVTECRRDLEALHNTP